MFYLSNATSVKQHPLTKMDQDAALGTKVIFEVERIA
jgi:hypothetical protein